MQFTRKLLTMWLLSKSVMWYRGILTSRVMCKKTLLRFKSIETNILLTIFDFFYMVKYIFMISKIIMFVLFIFFMQNPDSWGLSKSADTLKLITVSKIPSRGQFYSLISEVGNLASSLIAPSMYRFRDVSILND